MLPLDTVIDVLVGCALAVWFTLLALRESDRLGVARGDGPAGARRRPEGLRAAATTQPDDTPVRTR